MRFVTGRLLAFVKRGIMHVLYLVILTLGSRRYSAYSLPRQIVVDESEGQLC